MKRHYPIAPVLGVSAVVLAENQILLVKRANEPAKGIWSLPGGAVELGEELSLACAREVWEETGIKVQVGPLVKVVEKIELDRDSRVEYHYVIMDYLCRAPLSQPIAQSDADMARWSPVDDLKWAKLDPLTCAVITKAQAMAENA